MCCGKMLSERERTYKGWGFWVGLEDNKSKSGKNSNIILITNQYCLAKGDSSYLLWLNEFCGFKCPLLIDFEAQYKYNDRVSSNWWK